MVPWLPVKHAGRFYGTHTLRARALSLLGGDHTGGFHPPSNHRLGSAGGAWLESVAEEPEQFRIVLREEGLA